MNYETRYPIRFAHCDPAGIAYYPRLFELADAAVEDWTAHALGVTRRVLHAERGLGLPTVDLRARFTRPGQLGEELTIAVRARRIGRASLDLTVTASHKGEPRFEIRSTVVLMSLGEQQAEPWPSDLRGRIEAVLQPGPAS